MIEGVVEEDRRALVPLTLRGLRSTVTAQAIIDTSFSGAVAVPIPIGVELGLEFMGTVDLILADGTTREGFELVRIEVEIQQAQELFLPVRLLTR